MKICSTYPPTESFAETVEGNLILKDSRITAMASEPVVLPDFSNGSRLYMAGRSLTSVTVTLIPTERNTL
jgi:hypothetical protein